MYKHGFIVMRAQPFHNGHKDIIDRMIKECKYITIILGSIQESRTEKNPFTIKERMQMLNNVYKNNMYINIFGLRDIPNDDGWCNFVLNNIKKENKNFIEPDVYYCGTYNDGKWFDNGKIKIKIIDRKNRTGILDISATQIREMIRNNDNAWKNYVPKENISYIESLKNLV